MERIVIVGAGISGLATAYYLQERLPQADITLLEAQNRPGGTIWTERKSGFQFETGPNGFLNHRASTLRLCQKLGIDNEIITAQPIAKKRLLYHQDDLYEMPSSFWQFLRTPLLSWRSKWRLLTERFRSRSTSTEDESVHDFTVRRTTEQIADLFADALVTGIYAGDPKQLSLQAAFPRVALAEKQFGSVSKGLPKILAMERERQGLPPEPKQPQLLSFRPGLRLLIEILTHRLKKKPILGVPVRTLMLEKTSGKRPTWTIDADGMDLLQADAVILTCPAPRQAALVADVDPELSDLIAHIPYVPIVVVALGYRQTDVLMPTEGMGYLAPHKDRRMLLGVQYCSSIYPERAPNDCLLLRAMCGGWHRREIMTLDDDKLSSAVRLELRMTLGTIRPPVFMQIIRWDPAIPQYTIGHLDRVANIELQAARHPGLFLGGNAYHGVSLNDCTEQAECMTQRVAEYFQSTPACSLQHEST